LEKRERVPNNYSKSGSGSKLGSKTGSKSGSKPGSKTETKTVTETKPETEPETASSIEDIYLPVEGEQEIAEITHIFGDGHFMVRTFKNEMVKVHKGKSKHIQKLFIGNTILFSYRPWIKSELLGLSYDQQKVRPRGDILHKYSSHEVALLDTNGYKMDHSAEFESMGLSNVEFVRPCLSAVEKSQMSSRKEYLFDFPSSDSETDETDETDETEILFQSKKAEEDEENEDTEENEDDEDFCVTSTKSKKKRVRVPAKKKEFVDIFTPSKVDVPVKIWGLPKFGAKPTEYVPPTIEHFIARISWIDKQKNFGEAIVIDKNITIFIPKSAFENSIAKGSLSATKVLFPRDKVRLTAFAGKKGYEATSISC
jgi:hypothetical protein